MDGGAIYIKETQLLNENNTVKIIDCNFASNTAGYNGGGICADEDGNTLLFLLNSNFTGKKAEETGGGLYLVCRCSLDLCEFIENQAQSVGGAYLGAMGYLSNEPYDETVAVLLRFTQCKLIGNHAEDLASDLYINIAEYTGLFVLREIYVKSSSVEVPAIHLKSESERVNLIIKQNSFVVPNSTSDFCYMKIENTRISNVIENWWGRNNPYSNTRFIIDVDGRIFDISRPFDQSHVRFALKSPTLYANVQSEFELSPKNNYEFLPFFPYGVEANCFTSDGVATISPSELFPNSRRSIFFTPNKVGTVSLSVILDYENITYQAWSWPTRKMVVTWTGAGVTVGLLVYGIVRIREDLSDDISSFATFEEAINNIDDGFAIIVPPGVYRGIGNVGLNINKNIVIMSDPNQTGDVIIDGQGQSWIWNISATNITLLGLTFSNGLTNGDGGALMFNEPMDNCTIISNFVNNKAANGGAIYFASTGGNISYSKFTSNVATYDGGAVYFSDGGTIINDTFEYNRQTVVVQYSLWVI